MNEVFDPSATVQARPHVAALSLSDDAMARLESGQNVRGFLDRLLTEGLPADALTIIARALPVQLLVAWCCECVRSSLELVGEGAPIEAERAAVALAEQCLRDPSDENRQVCLEFAERGKRSTAGAWLATAAGWADGVLTPPGAPVSVPAPPHAVADAAVTALRLAALRGEGAPTARLASYAQRALTLFGPRPARAA
ncbi:MAG: hypothetical protein JOZ89_03655 [Gammaproteobacteria bacterium]|nr:hypothetical protein [Gammaproteobacteria bacterium]